MRIFVTLDGQEHVVTLGAEPSKRFEVKLDDGKTHQVDVVRVPGGVHVLVNGRSLDLAVSRSPDGVSYAARDHRGEASVEGERDRARSAKRAGKGAAKDIRAPMPGRVVAVRVAVGDEVVAGAPLVVVEAMKMENEIRAPIAGRIKEVCVAAGTSVEGRALLVVFE